MRKIKNELEIPKVFYCKHMIQGVVGYTDDNGDELRVLVKDKAIRQMSPSFIGRPVVVEHQEINKDDIKGQMDGVVVESFYNECDGWFWVKIVAITDAAQKAIRGGYKVSNAYYPTLYGSAGTYLNVPYDREVEQGEFDHLAIVENPRYEDAVIMSTDDFKAYNLDLREKNDKIKNEKENKKGSLMFKLFKKTEVNENVDVESTIVTLENGQDIALKDMISAVEEKLANEKEEKEKEEKKVNMDEIVKVEGKEMKISELVKKYEDMKKDSKKNEDDEEDKKESKKNEEDEDEKEKKEAKKNEDEDEKENEDEDEDKKESKKNSKDHFKNLKNAISKEDEDFKADYETQIKKLERGKEKY